jgi:hypothetical protein
MPGADQAALADYVVHNDGTRDELVREADALYDRLLADREVLLQTPADSGRNS